MDYGGLALTPSVLWAGDAPGWTGPRTLKVSTDGGRSWGVARNATGGPVVFGGLDVSYADPVQQAVGFASNWRTGDGGATWSALEGGVSGVVAHDADPTLPQGAARTLFGVANPPSTTTGTSPSSVVASADHGVSWAALVTLPLPAARDVAYDWSSGALYAAASGSLFKCTNTNTTTGTASEGSSGSGSSSRGRAPVASPAFAAYTCALLDAALPVDQRNSTRVMSVAVDPVDPSVVYVGQTKDIYAASNAVARSTDGGRSWVNMVLQTPLGLGPGAPLQGPHEVSWLRVHPVTRHLWAAGECFGLWTAPPPAR